MVVAAAPLALIIALAARYRIRTGADAYAGLLETSARMYIPALAAQLGIDHNGPLAEALGVAVTKHLRNVIPPPDLAGYRRKRPWELW